MATVLSIVSYPFLPARTGGQRFIALFYKYFSRWHRVICVTTQNNAVAVAEGYEVLNVLGNSPLRYINIFYFFSLRKLIRQRGVTHLIIEHPYYGWLGVLLKIFTGVRLIVHSHNVEGLRWKGLGKWWWKGLWYYEKWTHRRADYNFFIQEEEKNYAIRHWALDPEKCIIMTYGVENDTIPSASAISASRTLIRHQYSIPSSTVILFFNGAFGYGPNLRALEYILKEIDPLLRTKAGFDYRIMICGKDIPEELSGGAYPEVIFAGFVNVIDDYFRAADVFLNPVVDGGGIKTKLVDALGNNLTAVSVRNGAAGIDPAWCNGKLLICENGDWAVFASMVVEASKLKADTPAVYFAHFNWEDTTRAAAAFITK